MAEENETPDAIPAEPDAIPAEPESLEETETKQAVPESVDEAPADDATAGEAAAPSASAKRKRKRLPRRLRPQRTRPVRATSDGKRKPITREPKPEHERGRRQERRGVVVSSAMDKTIVVKVDVIKSHPRYKKVVRRSVKFHAHDESNQANVGDVVRIVETRPLSKTKHWRLAEVLEVAK
jgi:small subunit ribosomal protein S17